MSKRRARCTLVFSEIEICKQLSEQTVTTVFCNQILRAVYEYDLWTALDDQPGNWGSKLRCVVAWMPLPVEIREEKLFLIDDKEKTGSFKNKRGTEPLSGIVTSDMHPNHAQCVMKPQKSNN